MMLPNLETPMFEMWINSFASPTDIARSARAAELGVWDGLWAVVAHQSFACGAYVALALSRQVTDRIGLGTAATNPVTRVPAVTASSIASGIGRERTGASRYRTRRFCARTLGLCAGADKTLRD